MCANFGFGALVAPRRICGRAARTACPNNMYNVVVADMSDLADLYPGYASRWIDTEAGRIFARTGGAGPPLLLLHGYPQTNVMWHRVAPALAARFRLIIPDLPGYGGPTRRAPMPRTRPTPSVP